MKRINLPKLVESELERLYHNATLHSKLNCESDFECDLVQSQVEIECEMAIADIKYTCPAILEYGEVYQWGSGGRTLAPSDLISGRGGGRFRIKSIEDLEYSPMEFRYLYKTLKFFNDEVESFCKHVTDSAIEFIREEYSEEIERNQNKKRQHYSGVRYV